MVENRIVNISHIYFIKSALQIVCQCSLTRAHVRFKEIQLNESCTKYDLINARVTAGIAIALRVTGRVIRDMSHVFQRSSPRLPPQPVI